MDDVAKPPMLPEEHGYVGEPFFNVPRFAVQGTNVPIRVYTDGLCAVRIRVTGEHRVLPAAERYFPPGGTPNLTFVFCADEPAGWYIVTVESTRGRLDSSRSLAFRVLDPQKCIHVADGPSDQGPVHTVHAGEARSAHFSGPVSRIHAPRRLLKECLRAPGREAFVVLERRTADPPGSGRLEAYPITRDLNFRDVDGQGGTTLSLPPEGELEALASAGVFIDRIVTEDFIQLVPHEGVFVRADLAGRGVEWASFVEPELFGIARTRLPEILGMEELFASCQAYYPPLSFPASFTTLTTLVTLLQSRGYPLTVGRDGPGTFILVHQRNFRDRPFWLAAEDARPDAPIVESGSFASIAIGLAEEIRGYGEGAMRIVSPLLTSAVVVEQGESFSVYVDIPFASSVPGATSVETLVTDGLVLVRPREPERPFFSGNFPLSGELLSPGIPTCVEPITAGQSGPEAERFFRGTAKEPVLTTVIHSAWETSRLTGIGPMPNPAYLRPEERRRAEAAYYRRYAGLLDDCAHLYKVTFTLDAGLEPGLYLLRVRDFSDTAVHPVLVLPRGKAQLSICQITDLHLAARYDHLDEFLSKTLDKDAYGQYVNPNKSSKEDWPEWNAHDLVIATGDVLEYVNDGTPVEARFFRDRNWIHLEDMIRRFAKVPLFITLGNHDFKHNPTPATYFYSDLGVKEEELSRYRFDRPGASWLDVVASWLDVGGWIGQRTLEDFMFADENAIQYFFYNLCPHNDFLLRFGRCVLIGLDTKPDTYVFLREYLRDLGVAAKYAKSVASGQNPPPRSRGLTDAQLQFVEDALWREGAAEASVGYVFQHSSVLNPSLVFPDPLLYPENLKELPYWNLPRVPLFMVKSDQAIVAYARREAREVAKNSRKGGAERARESARWRPWLFFERGAMDEACLERGRAWLLSRMGTVPGRIRLIASGHVHKNLEFEVTPGSEGVPSVLSGNFSGHGGKRPAKINPKAAYLAATVSTGYMGYRWTTPDEIPPDATSLIPPSLDVNSYRRVFYGTGYRVITVARSGELLSMPVIEHLLPDATPG